MRRFWRILFGSFIAIGWPSSFVLNKIDILSDDWYLGTVIVLAICLIGQQVYLELIQPISQGQAQEIKPVVENLLRDFLAQYYTYVTNQKEPGNPKPQVRVNVMLPNVRFRGLWPQYLAIFYKACPNGVSYSDEETELKWKKNNGVSGWVWKKKKEAHYDQDTPNLRAAAKRRTNQQEDAVGFLKSVYSVPIWNQGKIVGILNLDSIEGINETYFDHRFVINLTNNFARDLAPILPNDGVAPQ